MLTLMPKRHGASAADIDQGSRKTVHVSPEAHAALTRLAEECQVDHKVIVERMLRWLAGQDYEHVITPLVANVPSSFRLEFAEMVLARVRARIVQERRGEGTEAERGLAEAGSILDAADPVEDDPESSESREDPGRSDVPARSPGRPRRRPAPRTGSG